MNILAINGSHRAGKGTAALLNAVLESAGHQGATCELIELSHLDIRFCSGCNACLGRNRCAMHDDMDLLYDKMMRADGIVLGSPVYFGTVSARMKNFMDRTRPLHMVDNALAGIPERLERANEQLNNLYNQQEAAKAEVGKPFPQEAELTAKSQRLAELDAALNMEDSAEKRDERSESERPSVLANLKSKAEHIPPAKYSETREEVL